MRTSDADLLFLSGWPPAGPEHWLNRWAEKLSTARPIVPDARARASRAAWSELIGDEVARAQRPVILIAHDMGAVAVSHAAAGLPTGKVKGAFLVAPLSERTIHSDPDLDPAFAPMPLDPLPFPSILVASRDDPLMAYAEAEDLGYAWGSAMVDAGSAGHIDDASGRGPWPEGLMRFAAFLGKL